MKPVAVPVSWYHLSYVLLPPFLLDICNKEALPSSWIQHTQNFLFDMIWYNMVGIYVDVVEL